MSQVSDLMTKNTISVSGEMLLMNAVALLYKHKIDGVPVIDKDIKVVGHLNEHDLILKDSNIHLPTLFTVLNDFDLFRQDRKSIIAEVGKVITTRVKDVMNPEPRVIRSTASIEEAAKTFSMYHNVNPLPVVNESGMLVGVVSRYDIIKYYSGDVSSAPPESKPARPLDDHINSFLKAFESKFLFVGRLRTQVWFAVSFVTAILFIVFGFYVAIASLVNISF